MKEKKIHIRYQAIIAILFFFFFTSPALSPAVGDKTIYLYWFIPFLDIHFLNYFVNHLIRKIKRKFIVFFVVLVMWTALLGQYFILIKIISIIACVVYLSYTKKCNTFSYLYWGINFNIIIAVVQFIAYYINPVFAYSLGPTNVSRLLWKEYATSTYTNMYSIWRLGRFAKLVRVCGWSREAGFFASLLIVVFLCYLFEEKKSKKQYIIFLIGYIISFSKISLLLIPVLFIYKFSTLINSVSIYICQAIYMIIVTFISAYLGKINYYTAIHDSISNRFIGYSVIFKLSLGQLLVGFKDLRNIDASISQEYPFIQRMISGQLNFCGYPEMIGKLGLIGYALFIFFMSMLGVGGAGILLIMLGTFNVDLFTATSYVVLLYWIVFDSDVFKADKQYNKFVVKV